MKRTFFLCLALIMVVTLALPGIASAQTATTTTWTSSIYYYNPSEDTGELQVVYYRTSGETPSGNIAVNAGGSGEVFIGDWGVGSTFRGSAVLSASVPLVAVYEQASNGADPNYARLLYTAFDPNEGGETVYIPTFVKGTGYTSQVGVQNIGTTATTATLTFTAQNGTEYEVTSPSIPTNTSYVFTGDDISALPNPFDGSLTISAPNGKIVAAAQELQANGRAAYAFEGISQTGTKVYMPSMMCRFSPGGQTSYYAIQNAGDSPATVTVDIYNDATKKVIDANGTQPGTAYSLPATIPVGAKFPLNLCNLKGTAYKGGTAVINSNEPLAVVGKIQATNGLNTSFVGKAAGHSGRTVLPYVVWSTNAAKGYRSYISVMNVGSSAATAVTAKFLKPDGSTAATVNLATGAKPLAAGYKASVNPSTARALRTDQSYRGAVEITSDQPVVVIVRLEKKVTGVRGYSLFGEDYLGIPYVPPED